MPVRARPPAPSLSIYRGVEQLVARKPHTLEVGGSSPSPATNAGLVPADVGVADSPQRKTTLAENCHIRCIGASMTGDIWAISLRGVAVGRCDNLSGNCTTNKHGRREKQKWTIRRPKGW